MRNRNFGLLLFILSGIWISMAQGVAATYDATGRWTVDVTPDTPSMPLAAGCLVMPKETIMFSLLSQSGDAFTIQEFAEIETTGTIQGEQYTYHINRSDGSVHDITLTLSSQDAATGTVASSWSDGAGGNCSATGSLNARRAHDASFSLSGAWTIQFGAEQLDATLSDPACSLASARSYQALIDQNGNRFTATLDTGLQLSGEIDRAVHIFADKQLLTQPHISVNQFVLVNANQGNGTTHWSRLQGKLACSGSNVITLTRSGVTVDPNGQLAIGSMNLTVGQSRGVTLTQVRGTPSITVEPESGVVTLETLGGMTTVRCDAEGSATLTVTDANGSATAPVKCVAGATGSPVNDSLSQWLFKPGVTLVTEEHWRGSESGSPDHRSVRWSQFGVATSFMTRGSLLNSVGDQGLYYTLDESGLTFHGERSFDSGQGKIRRRAYYGFVNAPSLESGAAGITEQQVAPANLKTPATALPGQIALGAPVTTLRLEQEIDANDQAIANRWNLVQQTIEVTGPIDLLAADPPASLASDSRFLAWRDGITDLELLGKLTSVIRLQVSESR
ncbi:MAG: hypothetical protein HQL86_03855, partial [Magnetococcales bacterium]|nr:hypothetical protein [Magnetococcales bacterium]